MLGLWSKRWSVTRGWHWAHERDCLPENVDAWLNVFKGDFPDVEFCISRKKPRGLK